MHLPTLIFSFLPIKEKKKKGEHFPLESKKKIWLTSNKGKKKRKRSIRRSRGGVQCEHACLPTFLLKRENNSIPVDGSA